MKRLSLCTATSLLALSAFPRWMEEGRLAPSQERPLGAGEVELVYLANEGFLVRSAERAFVIDAFLEEPLGQYAALTPELHAELVEGRGTFADVDLALVSHVHPDHFQPDSARAFLEASLGTRLATSPQVIETLESRLGEDEASEAIRARLEPLLPETGETLGYEHAGIEVAFLRLPHAGNRPSIQNLGHLIEFGGLTLLHVGDAEGSSEVFAPYDLAEVDLDVALLPYWYWQSPAGRKLVAEQLSADTLVAIHIPPGEVPQVAAALAPQGAEEGRSGKGGVHVFRGPLDRLRLEAR